MPSRKIHRALLAAALGLWSGAIAVAQTPAAVPERVEALTQESQFIFRGTVVRPGAANVAAVQAGPETAVVRVDEVVDGPRFLLGFTGLEVTVKLASPGSVTKGEQAVFFTRGWLYGESLAVVELGRMSPGSEKKVAAARLRIADRELQTRLDGAVLVVAGRVIETRPAAVKARGGEHDPLWREAVIAVDRVLKGAAAGQVVLLYPASRDRLWAGAPKPEAGWDGVWLLERGAVAGAAGYMALHPWNLMSRDDLAAIARRVQP
jgi:hypothetical protein